MFERIEIDAFSDVAIADRIDVILGVFGMNRVLLLNRLIAGILRLRRGRRLRGSWLLWGRRSLRLRVVGVLACLRSWGGLLRWRLTRLA